MGLPEDVVIFLVGPQGSGKGMITGCLMEFGFASFVTGDILRAVAEDIRRRGDPTKIQLLKRGKLWGDDEVCSLVEKWSGEEQSRRKIIDGTPRTQGQAHRIVRCVRNNGYTPVVLRLECSLQTSLDRIQARVLHDIAHNRAVREDDKDPKAVAERLQIFQDNVEGIVKSLEDLGVELFSIDTERGPDEVIAQVMTCLQFVEAQQRVAS